MTKAGLSFDDVVSIHAFRGEGDKFQAVAGDSLTVSIHAFRGEGDGMSIG